MPGKNWLGIATVATPHSETTGHHGHSQSERETRRVNRTAQKKSQTERDELWLAMPPATHLLTNTHWRQSIQGNAEHSLIIFTHSKKISNISMQKTSFVYLPVQQILWVASWNILSFLFFVFFITFFFTSQQRIKAMNKCFEMYWAQVSGLLSTNRLAVSGTLCDSANSLRTTTISRDKAPLGLWLHYTNLENMRQVPGHHKKKNSFIYVSLMIVSSYFSEMYGKPSLLYHYPRTA